LGILAFMNIASTAHPSYDSKSTDYFEMERPEMLPLVPAHSRRVLDVGCGAGGFGVSLKRARQVEVWGVEPMAPAAKKAMAKLDHVIQGHFGPELDLPEGTFDCVIFNDVLEHMVAPEKALRYANNLLSADGVVVASIPNIRSFPTFWQLLFHARWEYADFGVLDKTHLRFFTKSSIEHMFQNEGYSIESIRGINAYVGEPGISRRLWSAYHLANALFLGRFTDMRFLQFAIVARVAPDARV
jgi:2-polyprenyl-3-methyl-5-hydroxy-6-metoxy-1,4-benzoquinol methylase